MKSFLLAAAFAAFGATAAQSADIAARPYTKAQSMNPGYNWSGFYLGLNGGGAWGASESYRDNINLPNPPGSPTNFQSSSSAVAGGQIGARYQINQFVVGVEATADWTDFHSRFVNPGAGNFVSNFELSALYAVTGQVGFAIDRVLFYGKGGWAGASTTTTITATGGLSTIPEKQMNQGWTAGAGIEYAVWQNFVAGIAYDHYDLNYDAFRAPFNTGGTPLIVTNTSRLKIDQVVARLSYKFGG